MDMSVITSWPLDQRPRERLLELGPERLADVELLAVIIGTGSSGGGGNALELSRRALSTFGGLGGGEGGGIVGAGTRELLSVRGLGPAKVARIQAALELGRRLDRTPAGETVRFTSSRDVFREYGRRFLSRTREVLLVVLLDSRHGRIREMEISEGGLTGAVVHPRDVFLPAIREAAAFVLCVHNHPSGDPSPSPPDIETTHRLAYAGQLLGIPVLDHVIIGASCYYSLADEGLLGAKEGGSGWGSSAAPRRRRPKGARKREVGEGARRGAGEGLSPEGLRAEEAEGAAREEEDEGSFGGYLRGEIEGAEDRDSGGEDGGARDGGVGRGGAGAEAGAGSLGG